MLVIDRARNYTGPADAAGAHGADPFRTLPAAIDQRRDNDTSIQKEKLPEACNAFLRASDLLIERGLAETTGWRH